MPANPFVWYELMTGDLDAAVAFYGNVVGWTAQPFEGGDPPYILMGVGPREHAAGMMTMPDELKSAGVRPHWMGYIGCRDVDAKTADVRQAGGKVHREPWDIPNVGRISVVSDPGGAVFGLFQPKEMDEPPPLPAPMARGHVGWRELYAADGEQAFRFYADQFGWTKERDMDMGPMGVYRIFAIDGVGSGGMMTKPPQVPMPHWGFYFTVPEINAAVDRVKAHGGQVLNGPMEVPGGAWIIQALDPQGAGFNLVAPPPAAG
ncbi:glyoxalase [Alsobacter soli]|uniref:Glyoxalase n=1 Tax=Alsobacter soli TaxID=2109933 RepID=A0A2T1HP57_9HYPH|nr:VOC family protein [Alsobacter soli]PSC03401.1 glyoxalase [Alsobacter soli]